MFTYCNNNPTNLVDSSGGIPRELFAMSTYGGGGIFNGCGPWIPVEKSLSTLSDKTEQIIKAAYTSIEASVGVGLGLYGEADVGDVIGLGFGNSYNLLEVKLDDGKFSLQQSYNEGLSASFLFFDVMQNTNESRSRSLTFSSPLVDFLPDDRSNNWTIVSVGAYLYAGGSIYLGFDMVSFCQEVDTILFG